MTPTKPECCDRCREQCLQEINATGYMCGQPHCPCHQNQEKFCEHDVEVSYACPMCDRSGREYGKSAKPENQESEWEKELVSLLSAPNPYKYSEFQGKLLVEYAELKSFIRRLLSQAKKEERERLRWKLKEWRVKCDFEQNYGAVEAITDILNELDQ